MYTIFQNETVYILILEKSSLLHVLYSEPLQVIATGPSITEDLSFVAIVPLRHQPV